MSGGSLALAACYIGRGIRLGYALVGQFLKGNPDATPASLAATPASAFLPSLAKVGRLMNIEFGMPSLFAKHSNLSLKIPNLQSQTDKNIRFVSAWKTSALQGQAHHLLAHEV